MRPGHWAILATAIVAACSSSAEAKFRSDCRVIAMDPEGQENIAEMGTDTDGFCACAAALTANRPAVQRAQIVLTFDVIAAEASETGLGVEEVVGGQIRKAMLTPDDPDTIELQAGISLVGAMIDDIANGFESTGRCPAG